MGNAQSDDNRGEKYYKQFQDKFKYEVSKLQEFSDVFFLDVTLYHERDSKRVVAQVKKPNEAEHFDPEQERILEERINKIKSDNLLKVYGYYSNLQSDNICGNSYYRSYFVEHPVGTLTDEINLRKNMTPPRPYTEVELWGFLYSIASGLITLRDNGKKCKNISSSTIFISFEGFYQISELGIVKENSIFEEIIYKQFKQDMYLSPGQMELLQEQTFHDDTNAYMNDIYALGVLITEMAYLEEQGDIYRYFGSDIGIDYEKLKIRIQYLETKYKSKKLIRILMNMTEIEQKKRITLDELHEEVERNYGRHLQDRTNTDIQECPSHKTSFIETIINRSQYEHIYKKKNRENQSPDIKPRLNKKRLTSRINYEERDGDDGHRETKLLANQSMSQIKDEDYSNSQQGTLGQIKNEDLSSVESNPIKLKDHKGKAAIQKLMPAIQLSEFMMKKNREKQQLVQKQQELLQLQYKSKEQEDEIDIIQDQIIQIDKTLENQKGAGPDHSRNNTPNKQVHFQPIEEEQSSPRPMNQSKQIKVQGNVGPEQQVTEEIGQRLRLNLNKKDSNQVNSNLMQSDYQYYEEEEQFQQSHSPSMQNKMPLFQANNRIGNGSRNNSCSASPSNRSNNLQFNQFDQVPVQERLPSTSGQKSHLSPKFLAYSGSQYEPSPSGYSQQYQFFQNNNQQSQYYPNQIQQQHSNLTTQSQNNQNQAQVQYTNQSQQAYPNSVSQSYPNQQQQVNNKSEQASNNYQQNPQFGELFYQNQNPNNHSQRPSPTSRRYNLDRYNQRLNKNNVCSERYKNLKEIFEFDDKNQNKNLQDISEDSGKKFKNKLIKKQSISQIILSKSMKKLPQSRGVSPYQNTVKPFEKNNEYQDNKQTVRSRLLQNQNMNSQKDLSLSARELKLSVPDIYNFQLNTNRQKMVKRVQEIPQ